MKSFISGLNSFSGAHARTDVLGKADYQQSVCSIFYRYSVCADLLIGPDALMFVSSLIKANFSALMLH